MPNFVCMKWGTKAYSSHDVNHMWQMLRRHAPKNFSLTCITDDASGLDQDIHVLPLPILPTPLEHQKFPWNKIALYHPTLLEDKRYIFLDLDILIVGDLSDFLSYSLIFGMIENWTQRGRGIGNSSVMVFYPREWSHIYTRYIDDPQGICEKYANEQVYVSRMVGKDLSFFPRLWCQSFKQHCLPARGLRWLLPAKKPSDETKILVFHGYPKAQDALRGRYPGRRWPWIRKVTWIQDYI